MTDRNRTVRSRLGRYLRRALLSTGVAVIGLALVVAFVPGLEEYMPAEAAIEALGSDYVAVAIVGVAAVAFAALVVVVRRLGGVDEATPPPVETVPSAAYPGESFDQSTENRRFGLVDRSSSVDRERLRQAAIRAVSHAENCPRSIAERRVVEGSWTDDPVAARFLDGARESDLEEEPASGPATATGSPSRSASASVSASGSSPSTDVVGSGSAGSARRAAEAIVNVHAGEEVQRDSSRADPASSPTSERVPESAGGDDATADRVTGDATRESSRASRPRQSGEARAQRTDGTSRGDERDVRRERVAPGAGGPGGERPDGGKRLDRGEEGTDGEEEL